VRIASVVFAAIVAFATPSPHVGDPMAGHWELNLGRTHYGGGAERRTQETMICESTAGGLRCTIHSVRADGRTLVGKFTARYDGTRAKATGIPDVDTVRLVRIDDSIAEATFENQGKAVFAYRVVRSDDRRSLTIVAVDPVTRAALSSVVVYDAR